MKTILFFIISFCGLSALQAQKIEQDTMYFYHNGRMFHKVSIADVDSVKFYKAKYNNISEYQSFQQDTMYLYKGGAVCYRVPALHIDSITFYQSTEDIDTLNCGVGRFEGIPLLGYGKPTDRRVEAREWIAKARAKILEEGHPHDYALFEIYEQWKGIAMMYLNGDRLYLNAVRNGYSHEDKQNEGNHFLFDKCKDSAYNYLSDTVIIYIGGGPNYNLGVDYEMCLYAIASTQMYPSPDYRNVVLVLNSNFVLDRKYNQPYTSIIQVPHATAGVLPYKQCRDDIQFFDFSTAGGKGLKEWPENIISYQDAELVNDIGVELLRFTVEKLQSMGKTVVYWGSSWGAYTMTRYLLYYPIEDFAHVDLFGFNPNIPKEIIESDRHNLDYSEGTLILLYMEMTEMLRWRMLPWLTAQNLERMRIVTGGVDYRVGFPLLEEIKELTDAGATFVELVGMGHQFMGGDYASYSASSKEIVNTWESNMRVYTKDGVQVIQKENAAKPIKQVEKNKVSFKAKVIDQKWKMTLPPLKIDK